MRVSRVPEPDLLDSWARKLCSSWYDAPRACGGNFTRPWREVAGQQLARSLFASSCSCAPSVSCVGTAMSTTPRPRVLIIDDEPAILAVYPEVLGVDYDVSVA